MSTPQPLAPVSPTAVGIETDFINRRAPELARDIVAQIDTATKLAVAYGLTEAQWQVLRAWPAFIRHVELAHADLAGSAGAGDIIRRQALAALSTVGILDVATIAGDKGITASVRLDATKLLMDAGGVGAKAMANAGTNAASAPLIQIIVPNYPQESLVINSKPIIEHEDAA